VYNRHRAPDIEIGIFFNTERDNSHNERAIRQVLTNMGWTAGELADEYDRQHSAPATSINTGNKALDDVVNDILARHGRDAAVAYLQGLKAKNINKG